MTRSTTHDGAEIAGGQGNGRDDQKTLGPEHPAFHASESQSSETDGDLPGFDPDPILVELADEFSRRTLAGETVDIEQLVAAHPEHAEAFRKFLPILQGLAALEPVGSDDVATVGAEKHGPAAGKVFADFHIIREIGRGGMGVVYEARQATIGRRVALKVLPLAAAMDPKALQRFQLEAQVAGLLQHPHIVPVHAVGTVDQIPYFAMQYIEGGSLAGLIAELRGLVERGADHVVSPSSGDSPSALALGLLTGRFAPVCPETKTERGSTAPTGVGWRRTIRKIVRPTESLGHCPETKTERGITAPTGVGWRRTIRRIVRPTESLGHSGGPCPDASGRGTTLRIASGPAETSPQSIRGRTFHRTVARLGIQAAEALAYAHDQGIVHRDVKPANLLLDRRGDLWVADFGMADVQGDAGLTMTGDLPGTLRYMSPEQAAGKRALIDRRTDVYSLGATLYELLALQPAIVGSDRAEIIRRIAEQEPEPIRRLNPAVPVDLATIVTKALSKEPSKRYETARQLADDLERFLDDRPIAARPVGPLARTWRWCKRKPVPASLAAGLVLAIIVGFSGITWNWWKAQVAERRAVAQAAKADAVNRFLIEKLLGQASPNKNPNAKRVTLREALDLAATEVGSSFIGQPEIEGAIRQALGQTYHDLGDYSKTEQHFRAAYELYSRQPAANGEGRLSAMSGLGHCLDHLGRLDEADPLLVEATEESARRFGRTGDLCFVSTGRLATLRQHQGRLGDAEAIYRRLVDDHRSVLGPKHPYTLIIEKNLGLVLEEERKYDEAEQLFRECLRLGREVQGPEHPDTLVKLGSLASTLGHLGRTGEAESLFRRCLEAQRRVIGPEHPNTLATASGLASFLRSRGRLDEAESLLDANLESQRRSLGPDHADTLKTVATLEEVRKERRRANASAKK